jgi:hypothetical protein
MMMKTALALAVFAALTYATFGRLNAAETCPYGATTIEAVMSQNAEASKGGGIRTGLATGFQG